MKVAYHGVWDVLGNNAILIDCYVTDDKKRLLSLRGTARAMGFKGGGSTALVRNLSAQWIRPYLSDSVSNWLNNVDTLERVDGARGKDFIPFESDLFVDLCNSYVKAKNDGIFDGPRWKKQSETADKMLAIMSAFAKVGIVAIIDEITGYQVEREKDELQKILAHYINKELLPWAKRFPDEFYIEMFRLKGWEYRGIPKPPYVGKLTNYLVYEQLPEGVIQELKIKNPINERGNRLNRHHQFLTDHTGIPHLDKHLSSVITLMRISDNWNDFEKNFKKAFNVKGQKTFDIQ